MRRIAVEVLIHSEPDKVHVDSNINQWLDLSKEDKQIIAKRNKRYAELLNLLDSAKTRPAHPDGDKVRALMRDKISGMDEYKNLIAKLLTVIDKINSSKCNSRK
jgi:ABC-type sugar transport system ATPase subunit